MNDSGLDRGLAEQMLRRTHRPPRLAELLAAASSDSTVTSEGRRRGRHRVPRSAIAPLPPPCSRRSDAVVSLKAALITFLLTLADGVITAARVPSSAPPAGRPAHPQPP